MEQELAEVMNPQRVDMWIGGVPHRGRVSHIANDTLVLKMSNLRVPPEELVSRPFHDVFLHFRGTTDPHYRSVSLLKSAYLSVFSLLGVCGYRFAEGKAICQVREQIMDPERKIIENFAFSGSSDPKGDWIFLNREVRPCWVVKMGDWIVLLPRSGDTSFYKDAEIPTKDRSRQFRDLDTLKPSTFGKNEVVSITFEKGRSTTERFGVDPFGTEIAVEQNGETRKFVVADYGERDITLLPYLGLV